MKLDDLLLPPVHPAGEENEEKLPGLERFSRVDPAKVNVDGLEELEAEKAKNTAAAVQSGFENWEKFTTSRKKGYIDIREAIKGFKELQALEEYLAAAATGPAYQGLKSDRDTLHASFTGRKKNTTTWTGQFRWLPRDRPAKQNSGTVNDTKTLFTLHSAEGPSWSNLKPDLMPSKKFMEGEDKVLNKINSTTTTSITVSCSSEVPSETELWAKAAAGQSKRGWHYRVPGRGHVKLSVGEETKVNMKASVGQHGCVAFLPATTGGKAVASKMSLDPISGALTSVTHGGTAFDPAGLTTAAGSVAGVITADAARDKAKASESDVLTKLQRKATRLKLEKEISDLEGSASSD